MQGSNGIFNSFRHCIHFGLLRNIFTTDNSFNSGFHTGEVLVVILVQCICFGNGCIYLSIISVLVLQGSNGIFNSFRHCINFGLLRNIFTTDNSIHSCFHAGEVLVVILLQSICFGNGCIYLSIISILVLQGSNGIFNSFRHCIHFGLLRNIFTTDNSFNSGFHTGEVLVVILVQCICFGNGCIYLSIISVLVLQGSNGIFNSFRHCINLCLLGSAFCSVNRVNGIFYHRIICIKAAIKSRCPCDGCIDSCVISGDVIVIPHKSWMTDSGNPFNASTGIGLQASKNIVRVKVVGSGSG